MPINKDMTNKFGICPSTGHLSVLFPEKEAERTPSNKIFLAIVLQGGAMIEIDGKNHLIHTGTLIYLYPNHLVRQISHTEDLLFEYSLLISRIKENSNPLVMAMYSLLS